MECVDVLSYCPRWFRWGYPQLYWLLVRSVPSFWASGYYLLDSPWVFRVIQPWRRRWNRLMARRFLAWVSAAQPDIIIVTHFFAAEVVAGAKRDGRLACRLIVVMTDLFPHRLWLVPEAEAVVVGSSLTKRLCEERGITEDRLHVLGIPIGGRFGVILSRMEIAKKLHLDPTRRTILIASGGMGIGPVHQLVQRLVALEEVRPQQIQLLVVCGYNQALARRLEQAKATLPMPIHVFGFVDTMPELMQASDLLVTKAGGLTVMEALATGLPMILCGTIAGQEDLNAAYVVQQGAAVRAATPHEVARLMLQFLDHPEQLHALHEKATALGRPNAAQELVEQLLAS